MRISRLTVCLAGAAVVCLAVGCDLFSAQGSLIRGRNDASADPQGPQTSVTVKDGRLSFSYERGNEASSSDRAMRSLERSVERSAAGFVPGKDSGGAAAVSDLEEAINTVQLIVINTLDPENIADFDETFDDSGAPLRVSVDVTKGDTYHVLMLLGHRAAADNYERTLLKSGYLYLTTAEDSPDNKITVPLYPIVLGVGVQDPAAGTLITQGRLAKRIGLRSEMDYHLSVNVGSAAMSAGGTDDTLFEPGGNGLYALMQAEYMHGAGSNAAMSYNGNGTVSFYDARVLVIPGTGNPAVIYDAGTDPLPLAVAGEPGKTPVLALSFDDGGVAGDGIRADGDDSFLAFNLSYAPFGLAAGDSLAGGIAENAWWNWKTFTAFTKEGGWSDETFIPVNWTIRNGLNDLPESPLTGFDSVNDGEGDTTYGAGAIPVVIAGEGGEQSCPPGVYEGLNRAPILGSVSGDGDANALTGAAGDLLRGLAFLNARGSAATYGNYIIRLGADETGLTPNYALATSQSALRDISLVVQGTGGASHTLTLTSAGDLFDAGTSGVRWSVGPGLLVAVSSAPPPTPPATSPALSDISAGLQLANDGTRVTITYTANMACTVNWTAQLATWNGGTATKDDIAGSVTPASASEGTNTVSLVLESPDDWIWYAYAENSAGDTSPVYSLPLAPPSRTLTADDKEIQLVELFKNHASGTSPAALFDLGVYNYPETAGDCYVPLSVGTANALSKRFNVTAVSWKRGNAATQFAVSQGASYNVNMHYYLTMSLSAIVAVASDNIFSGLSGDGGFSVTGTDVITSGYTVTVTTANVTADTIDLILDFPPLPSASLGG